MRPEVFFADLLCFKSLWTVARKKGLGSCILYYAQKEIRLHRAQAAIARKLRIDLRPLSDVSLASAQLEGVSAYLWLQERLYKSLQKFTDLYSSEIKNQKGQRRKEFFFDSAMNVFYRPVELITIAKLLGHEGHAHFILKGHPYFSFLEQIHPLAKFTFYNTKFITFRSIEIRSSNAYDKVIIRDLIKSNASLTLWLVAKHVYRIFLALTHKLFVPTPQRPALKSNILVEQLQGRYRKDEINDLYWMEAKGLNPQNIYYYLFEQLDRISIDGLKKLKVNLLGQRLSLIKYSRSGPVQMFFPVALMPSETVHLVRALFKFLRTSSWVKRRKVLDDYNFESQKRYWKEIYSFWNIKIMWSMADSDPNRNAKAQALLELGGVYTGAHWSFFAYEGFDNRKVYDLIFSWGPYFKENVFHHYPQQVFIHTGYPLSYYFPKYRLWANHFRKELKIKDPFILSFIDNSFANDIPFDLKLEVDIHRALLGLLEKYPHIVLILKPKRKAYFDILLEAFSELNDWLKNERVHVFFGENSRTKAVPAAIGMASDLVVGQSMSSAGAECFFAGTPCLFHDPIWCESNSFAVAGANRIYFSDMRKLIDTIENFIIKPELLKEDFSHYFKKVDPFLDQLGAERTGQILNELRDALEKGSSPQEAISLVSETAKILSSNNSSKKLNRQPCTSIHRPSAMT